MTAPQPLPTTRPTTLPTTRATTWPTTRPATRPAPPLAPGRPSPEQEPDAGMATAEYAIATLAACGFAALLVTVLGSDQVRGMLLSIVQRALSLG